ncbi:uncharacterized protein V2V93DRAFT_379848 [Kockiozyma suomiensis]|uniref:uncharacterized protein n=1 Tax=Kockiozyma suomiensis TaxID=1337062 RepID=UPI003343BF97
MSQDEDEYAVEAILSHGYDKATGHLLYYVKWEGYDEESDNTWESVSNLDGCKELLDEYHAKVNHGKPLPLTKSSVETAPQSRFKKKRKTSKNNGVVLEKEEQVQNNINLGLSSAPTTPTMPKDWAKKIQTIHSVSKTSEDDLMYHIELTDRREFDVRSEVLVNVAPHILVSFLESHIVFESDEET